MSDDYNKNLSITIVCLSLLLIGFMLIHFRVYPAYQRRVETRQKLAELEDCRAYFLSDFPDELKASLKEPPVEGEYNIVTTSEWGVKMAASTQYRKLTNSLRVELITDDSFNELSKPDRYYLLKKFAQDALSSYQDLISDHYPWYFEPGYFAGIKYDAEYISLDPVAGFFIKTPSETYKYLTTKNRYGIGEDGSQSVPIYDPITYSPGNSSGSKPTPKPTQKPSYSYSPPSHSSGWSDPWEADRFDDPDEYADYFAEDFADEYDEDIDEAYLDAYDHWVEWHEGEE